MWSSLGLPCLGLSELPGLLCPFSLTRLGKFSVISSPDRFLIFCSLSSPSGTSMMKCCYTSCCPKDPLNYLHFFLIIFSFLPLFWEFSATLSSKLLIQYSISSSLLLIPSSVFFISGSVLRFLFLGISPIFSLGCVSLSPHCGYFSVFVPTW